ncbi:hypothetical protein VHEMI02853 [[Torrubiella] hemipterigena]|uniref:Tubby C-terminal-like domain-containing protein n=1 Tax=[Torrubiella] hemipterigena TaxID=1531966 RepID=A0A0A1SWX1_9HYPO|nr:hypothetical protein VHEMI02853 [[Torrubiella] hemipterigena]
MSRSLDIVSPGWGGSRLEVVDPSTSAVLYKYETKGFLKKHIEITRTSEKPSGQDLLVGKITFPSWSSGINIDMGNEQVTLKRPKMFSSSYTFASRTLSGKWKHPSSLSSRIELITTAGDVVAKFGHASWSFSKKGTLEVFGNPSQQELDMVMITAFTMIAVHRRNSNGAAAGASAGGAAAGAGGGGGGC